MSHIDHENETDQERGEPPFGQVTVVRRQPQLIEAAAGAVLAAALAWVLLRLRRRRQPTPSERLVEATRALGAASAGLAGRAAGRAAEVAAPVAERTEELALHGVRAGVEGATRAGSALADVPHLVAEGGEKVHRAWTKWTGRLILSLAAGTGYVLGARAGRSRYEQIVRVANGVAQRPEVQQARGKIKDLTYPHRG